MPSMQKLISKIHTNNLKGYSKKNSLFFAMNRDNKLYSTFVLLMVSAVLFVGCKPYQQFDNHLSRIIYRNKIQEKYAMCKDKTIHYFATTIHPKRQTIVLLHGFGADAKLQWTKTAKLLSKKYNVVFIDLAFHGKTKSSIIDYSFAYQAAVVKEVLDNEKITTKVNILGNSYGAMVASFFAEKYPEQIDKLILNDALTCMFTTKIADSVATQFKVNSLYNLLNPLSVGELKKTCRVVFHKKIIVPNFIAKSVINDYFLPKESTNLKLFNYITENEKQLSRVPKLNPKKTFYIWGSQDQLIPKYIGKQHQIIVGVADRNWYEIKRTAHVPNLERNRKFCKIVDNILKD
jgi:pimeloyl-ACP methyl ester carboxylesterase